MNKLSMKEKLFYFVKSVMGFTIFVLGFWIQKLSKKNHIIALYFHNPSPKVFEQCIKYLAKKSYIFINPERLENILNTNEPIDKKYILVTFDDGWRENIKLLPIVEKYQVYMTLFVSTEPIASGNFWWEYVPYMKQFKHINQMGVEKLKRISNTERLKIISEIRSKIQLNRSAMTLEELKEFSKNKYITIGSHTVNHPITIMCSDEELGIEYSQSKKTLEEWLNNEIKYFAYPNGDYNSRDIKFLSNYSLAFTVNCGSIQHNVKRFEIPRYGLSDEGGFFENRAKMLGLWCPVKMFFFKIRSILKI